MTKQNMKVALYARVSTKDKGQDCENQLAQLRDFAAKQGWEVAYEFVDQRSGKNGDRPQFQKMLDAASRHEFGCLLFWSLDRLTREGALATLRYLEQLTSYCVGYRSLTESYLDSVGAFRDAVIAILGCIARQERQRLSERVLAGLSPLICTFREQSLYNGFDSAICVHLLEESGSEFASRT